MVMVLLVLMSPPLIPESIPRVLDLTSTPNSEVYAQVSHSKSAIIIEVLDKLSLTNKFTLTIKHENMRAGQF